MTNNNKAFPLPQRGILPTAADAVAAYENQGGHLTYPEPYGVDLLANHPGLQQQRLMQLLSRFSSFDTIFHHLVFQVISGGAAVFYGSHNFTQYFRLTITYDSACLFQSNRKGKALLEAA